MPFFGHLSDKIGRKRMYIIGRGRHGRCSRSRTSGCSNTGTGALVTLAIVLSLIPHDMQYGPQAALIAETFPTRLRYSGAGIGYQLASVVAGGPAPLLAAWLLHTFNSSLPIALYIIAGAVVTIVATVLLPEPNRAAVAARARGRARPAGLAPLRARRDARRNADALSTT